jgi:hypothetical protein
MHGTHETEGETKKVIITEDHEHPLLTRSRGLAPRSGGGTVSGAHGHRSTPPVVVPYPRIPERHGQDWLANVQVKALEVLFSVPVALTDIIDERPRPRCLELGCLRGPPSTADASGTGSRSARERYLVSVAPKAMVKGNGMPVGSDVREWLRAAQRAETKVIAAIHKTEAAEPMPRHHQRLTLDHGSLTIGIHDRVVADN